VSWGVKPVVSTSAPRSVQLMPAIVQLEQVVWSSKATPASAIAPRKGVSSFFSGS
jgi:hypothetical protein